MDRFTQLRSFVLVAESGSFSAAARRERVTPVVMGRRLDALERRLSVRLVVRSTGGVKLTDEGRRLLVKGRLLLSELEETERSVSGYRLKVGGELRVSAPAAFGRLHVASHGPAFQAKYPDVRLSFELSDEVVNLIRDGIDCAIRIGGNVDPDYVAVPLCENRRVVCASPDYVSRHGKPRTPQDLLAHNCLSLKARGSQQQGWLFREGGEVSAVHVQGTLSCNGGELLYAWAKKGLGLAWRSTWEVQPALARGELVTVLDDQALSDYDIRAIYPKQRYLPSKVRAFVYYLKRLYKTAGYWDTERALIAEP